MATNAYKRALASLDNGEVICIYNVDTEAELKAPIILSGLPVVTLSKNSVEQYKLSHPQTGWFCAIASNDEARMPNVLLTEDEESILIEVKPFKTYSPKDKAKAKPFKGASK